MSLMKSFKMVLMMKNMRLVRIVLSAAVILTPALTLTACSNAKKQLGIERSSPDEFSVVKRAPLSMPPDYALTPPRPGAPRPQEQAPVDQAKQAVFGSAGEGQTAGAESILLQKAGAQKADPDIRQRVDAETEEMKDDNIPVARKLFGFGGDPDTAPTSVVDAKKEAERLEQNKAQGKPATAGETPAVER
jgi:hypothetical protein